MSGKLKLLLASRNDFSIFIPTWLYSCSEESNIQKQNQAIILSSYTQTSPSPHQPQPQSRPAHAQPQLLPSPTHRQPSPGPSQAPPHSSTSPAPAPPKPSPTFSPAQPLPTPAQTQLQPLTSPATTPPQTSPSHVQPQHQSVPVQPHPSGSPTQPQPSPVLPHGTAKTPAQPQPRPCPPPRACPSPTLLRPCLCPSTAHSQPNSALASLAQHCPSPAPALPQPSCYFLSTIKVPTRSSFLQPSPPFTMSLAQAKIPDTARCLGGPLFHQGRIGSGGAG